MLFFRSLNFWSGCTLELSVILIMTGLHNYTEIGQSSCTAFKMCKIDILWFIVYLDVAQCSLVDVHQGFG
jgi:hypothetical protein